MKNILISLFAAISSLAFSQNLKHNFDTNYIVSDSIYKKGIYRSFEEFKYNNPSITEFSAEKSRLWIKDNVTGAKRKVKNKDKVWGFCDGKQVYVLWRKYNPIEIIDRYSYFQERGVRIATVVTGYPLMIIPLPVPYRVQVVINFNNGKMFVLSKKMMRTILAQDPELLDMFKHELNKKQKFEKYIRLYNQRNKDQIKV